MKRKLVVEVTREVYDGQLYSAVRVDPPEQGKAVVIDRESRRGPIDAQALKCRAEALAKLLGLPLKTDLRWKCAARYKVACRCPKCAGACDT